MLSDEWFSSTISAGIFVGFLNVYFLEQEYERTKSDEIVGLLSSLSWKIMGGAEPADLGAWEDRKDSVKKALLVQETQHLD